MTSGLENLSLLVKTDWSGIVVGFVAENTDRVLATKIHVDQGCSRYGVSGFDEPF